MFQLSEQQLTQLRNARARACVPQLATQLCAAAMVNSADWSESALRDDTLNGVNAGLAHGLASGRDIFGYLCLRHTLGLRFDELPEIRLALRTPSQPEGWRVCNMLLSFDIGYWEGARARLSLQTPSAP